MLLRRTSNYCKQSRKRVDRLRSFSLLANSQNAQYSGAGGYRLEVISRARTLPRPFIGAHAHAWRVHYGKYHLRLVAVVVFGVEFAIEGVSPFVHAECAEIQLASSPQTSHSHTGASFWLKRRTLSLPMRPSRSSTTRSFSSVEVPKS